MRHRCVVLGVLLAMVGGCSPGSASAPAETPQAAAPTAPVQQAQATAPAVSATPAVEVNAPAKAVPPAETATAPAATPTTAEAKNAPAVAKSAYATVLIKDVPHVKQKPDFCGEACAEMALKRLGRAWTQDDVFNVAGVDPLLGRGCYTKELAAALTTIGFTTGNVFAKVAGAHAADEMEREWRALYADLARDIPSIVCMHYDASEKATEHFRLVLGYDAATDEVLYNEPAEDGGAYRRMKRPAFLNLWPLKYSADAWTVVRLRLEPGTLRDPAPRSGFTAADYAQHMMGLKKKIPAQGFTVALAAPFVVIGDETADKVHTRAELTVKWAAAKLKADFFKKDPDEILDIWLFKDDASYRKHAKEIFNDTPTTPYGYFSAAHGALIMNIETGGGTLVHEIVHPYMRANFPECPDWFNEGMGSLYEQSEEKSGHIHGLTNWRLPALQDAIKDKKIVPFKTLMATTSNEFYNSDKGTNYAQARYLCYYLQEKGLLVKYYREFSANHKVDPSGYGTLQRVLNESNMAAFQKKWEEFTMALKFQR
jgi:hypothetical protein